MVLIGCKTDLRKDKEQLRKLRAAQLEPITYTQVGRGPRTATARNHLGRCLLNWSVLPGFWGAEANKGLGAI